MSKTPPEGQLVRGFHPVREALRNRPEEVVELRILARKDSKRSEELAQLAGRHRVTVKHGGEQPTGTERYAALLRSAGSTSSGPPASGLGPRRSLDRPTLDSGSQVGPLKGSSAGDPNLVVLLEDLQDPRNLGAVLRVCEGAGVGQVLIRHRGSAPISPTVVKAASGATEWLNIDRYTNTVQELERLRQNDFWLFACDADGQPPWDCDLTGPVVLCFGGEHRGLRARTKKTCDVLVGLPMQGQIGSLNVSTAVAAILFESLRQRQRQG